MATYNALSNFVVDRERIARKGETLELTDAEALELLRMNRIAPADDEARQRFKSAALPQWGAAEPPPSNPRPWLPWR